MTADPDVTVIVPTHQGTRYLGECLDSVAAQDLTDVEVLVVDDASTDGSAELARSYAEAIPNLRVEVNPERLGAAANVARCIEAARGRWVKPVFQDDLIDPGCLTTMRDARRRGVPAVVADRRYRYEGEVPQWQRDACEHLLERSLVRRHGGGHLHRDRVAEAAAETVVQRVPQLNFVGEPVAVLLDRKALIDAGGLDTGYVQLWDYEVVVRLAMRRGVVLVAEPQATFRVHADSETSRNLGGSAFGINVLDRLRIQVAYATDPVYRPVRSAAHRLNPPVELTVPAIGVTRAARRIAEELPEPERAPATAAVERLAAALPVEVPDGVPSPWEADNAETALLLELSDRDLPPHLAEMIAAAEAEAAAAEAAEAATEAADVEAAPPAEDRTRPRAVRAVGRGMRDLRTHQWWGHMLGPLLAFSYLQIGWRQVPPGEGAARTVAVIACAIALAAYGYVVNDSADIVPDRLAGKPNAMARFSPPVRLGIIATFGVLGALPWTVVPIEGPAWLPFIGCYVMPVLYSTPPVRLKERHLLGPIADATNAFLLPALFAVALFAPLGEPTGPHLLMPIGAVLWTMAFGLRAILKHQVDTVEEDIASGTRTLAVQVGVDRIRSLVRNVLFPAELIAVALLAATVATWSWGTVAVAVAAVAVLHALRLTGVIERYHGTTTLDNGWWLYWYQVWPALLLSVALAVSDPWYLLLVAFLVLLLGARLRAGLTVAGRGVRNELDRHREQRRQRVSG